MKRMRRWAAVLSVGVAWVFGLTQVMTPVWASDSLRPRGVDGSPTAEQDLRNKPAWAWGAAGADMSALSLTNLIDGLGKEALGTAFAERRAAAVTGRGARPISELVEAYNRQRQAYGKPPLSQDEKVSLGARLTAAKDAIEQKLDGVTITVGDVPGYDGALEFLALDLVRWIVVLDESGLPALVDDGVIGTPTHRAVIALGGYHKYDRWDADPGNLRLASGQRLGDLFSENQLDAVMGHIGPFSGYLSLAQVEGMPEEGVEGDEALQVKLTHEVKDLERRGHVDEEPREQNLVNGVVGRILEKFQREQAARSAEVLRQSQAAAREAAVSERTMEVSAGLGFQLGSERIPHHVVAEIRSRLGKFVEDGTILGFEANRSEDNGSDVRIAVRYQGAPDNPAIATLVEQAVSGAVVAATTAVDRDAPGLQVRDDIREQHAGLFGMKRVNGRDIDVEGLIAALLGDEEIGGKFPELLDTRRQFHEDVTAGKAKYQFANPREAVVDADGNTLTVAQIRQGMIDGFLGRATEAAWQLNPTTPIPDELMRPGLQGTGPYDDVGMAMGALSTRAASWMPDYEDASNDFRSVHYQSWENLGQLIAGEWDGKTFTHPTKVDRQDPGKPRTYTLREIREHWPVLVPRVPGIHLRNRHMSFNGQPVPALIPAIVIMTLNYYESLTEHGSGPRFYVPKFDTPDEALLLARVLKALEDHLGLVRGTIKIEMLNERALYTANQELIMWILREWLVGPNVGRWDYISSRIEMMKDDPSGVFPDPHVVSMVDPTMTGYTRRNALLTLLVKGFPIGGMSAVMTNPAASEEVNARAVHSIWFDKLRERLTGLFLIDGQLYDAYRQSWVATTEDVYVRSGEEPLIVELDGLQALIDRPTEQGGLTAQERRILEGLGLLSNGQIHPFELSLDELTVEALWSQEAWDELFGRPQGGITEVGLRYAIYMASEYMFQILNGNFAAAIEDPLTRTRLMNDLATYEIFWHWLWTAVRHEVALTADGDTTRKGDRVTRDLILRLLNDRTRDVEEFFARVPNTQGFDRSYAPIVMDLLQRQLLQPRWITYGARVLMAILEVDDVERERILQAILSPSREDVVRAVRAGALQLRHLAAHDFVYDVYPKEGGPVPTVGAIREELAAVERAEQASRRPLIGGNWKSNIDSPLAARELLLSIAAQLDGAEEVDVFVGASYTQFEALQGELDRLEVVGAIPEGRIALAAQDVSPAGPGAHTGEVSAQELRNLGVTYVIVGHSEQRRGDLSKPPARRTTQSSEVVNDKVKIVLANGLKPVVAVGETYEEYQAGQTFAVVEDQVRKSLAGLSAADMANAAIAYEPVWAIGTGLSATTERADQVQRFIRALLVNLFGEEVAVTTRIQYGGSMNPANAAGLLAQSNIDGGLIGGASLRADQFAAIVETAGKDPSASPLTPPDLVPAFARALDELIATAKQGQPQDSAFFNPDAQWLRDHMRVFQRLSAEEQAQVLQQWQQFYADYEQASAEARERGEAPPTLAAAGPEIVFELEDGTPMFFSQLGVRRRPELTQYVFHEGMLLNRDGTPISEDTQQLFAQVLPFIQRYMEAQLAAGQTIIQSDGAIGDDPTGSFHARQLLVGTQYLQPAYAWRHQLTFDLPEDARSEEPDILEVYFPNWRQDITAWLAQEGSGYDQTRWGELVAEVEARGLSQLVIKDGPKRLSLHLNFDYIGEAKMGPLSIAMFMEEEAGGIPLQAALAVSRQRTLDGTMTNSAIVTVGSSLQGKSTITINFDPAQTGLAEQLGLEPDGREQTVGLNDDIVLVSVDEDGVHIRGTEKNYYSVPGPDEDVSRQVMFENVPLDLQIMAPNMALDLVRNRRTITSRERLNEKKGVQHLLAEITNGRMRGDEVHVPTAEMNQFVFQMVGRRRDVMPLVERLTLEEYIRALMYGEAVNMGAATGEIGAEIAELMGDPFPIGHEDRYVNTLLKNLRAIEATGKPVRFYKLNTGWVGEGVLTEEAGKIPRELTLKLQDALLRDAVKWEYEPVLGREVAVAIVNAQGEEVEDLRGWLPSQIYEPAEYARRMEVHKRRRFYGHTANDRTSSRVFRFTKVSEEVHDFQDIPAPRNERELSWLLSYFWHVDAAYATLAEFGEHLEESTGVPNRQALKGIRRLIWDGAEHGLTLSAEHRELLTTLGILPEADALTHMPYTDRVETLRISPDDPIVRQGALVEQFPAIAAGFLDPRAVAEQAARRWSITGSSGGSWWSFRPTPGGLRTRRLFRSSSSGSCSRCRLMGRVRFHLRWS